MRWIVASYIAYREESEGSYMEDLNPLLSNHFLEGSHKEAQLGLTEASLQP